MKINSDIWPENIMSINPKKLFFWGAGRRLQYFLSFMERENIKLIPDNIIDNDIAKKNIKKEICGNGVFVIPWDDVQIKKDEFVVIIITLKNYQEIIERLEMYHNNENMHILTYEYVVERYLECEIGNKSLEMPIKRRKKAVIPKIIHYCWFGGKPIPEKNKKYIESWRRYCPDYEIKEWNESNYDISKCLYMKQAWEHKYWAFVSDYARLDVVYEYGGIYLDTDVEVLKNLDDLLHQGAYLGFENNLYVATGLGFGARKNHPIIKGMRDDYNMRVFKKEDGTFNLSACPMYQTEYLKRHGLKTNGRHQYMGDVTIYPASVLCSYCYQSKREIRTPYSYTMHHYDASWKI